jgi:NAD(P) transhydrogenase subunit beta
MAGLLVDLAIIGLLLVGVGQFTRPERARWGNLTAAAALAVALGIVLGRHAIETPWLVAGALVAGGLAGMGVALRVTMLQIPAMVALQHGAGAVAALVVAWIELLRHAGSLPALARASGLIGVLLGAGTCTASLIASAKLANWLRTAPTVFRRHGLLMAGLLGTTVALAVFAGTAPRASFLELGVLALLSATLGGVFAVRIGGADMPVLISFLNATTGLAAAFCGIVVHNRLLIACGATVAASGSILTLCMCRAMNRNVVRFLLGWDGHRPGGEAPGPAPEAEPAAATLPSPLRGDVAPLEQAAAALRAAQTVLVIPGYGMALAQAQFATARLVERLRRLGKVVRYAIHPLAGRMPGHMHVLLAEAEADPDLLCDLEEVNPEFSRTDLALVVGACDVVNPAATTVPNTPISGMPILAAHEARHVVVCNLDARPGYSGVENTLYRNPKTVLVLGDAKASLCALLAALDAPQSR